MFVRIFKNFEEVLINTDHISLIEVEYVIPAENQPLAGKRMLLPLTFREASENPNAIRIYKFSIGGQDFIISADQNNEVTHVFSELYLAAVKSSGGSK